MNNGMKRIKEDDDRKQSIIKFDRCMEAFFEASKLFKVGGDAPGLVEEGPDRYYAFSDGPHVITRRGK